jgi:hypothetical protein
MLLISSVTLLHHFIYTVNNTDEKQEDDMNDELGGIWKKVFILRYYPGPSMFKHEYHNTYITSNTIQHCVLLIFNQSQHASIIKVRREVNE